MKDDWPPTKWLREKVEDRTGEESGWTTLVTCPWCWSVYVTSVLYLVDEYAWRIPTLLLMMTATMALVGYLGTWDQRDDS